MGSGMQVAHPSAPRPQVKPAWQWNARGPPSQVRWQKAQRAVPSAKVAHLEVAAAQQRCVRPSAEAQVNRLPAWHAYVVSGGCVLGGGSWAAAGLASRTRVMAASSSEAVGAVGGRCRVGMRLLVVRACARLRRTPRVASGGLEALQGSKGRGPKL